MAGPAIAVAATAGMLCHGQSIQCADLTVADRSEHVLSIGEQATRLARGETTLRPRGGGSGLGGTSFGEPFLPAAIQHGRVVMTELVQKPPDSRGPPDI